MDRNRPHRRRCPPSFSFLPPPSSGLSPPAHRSAHRSEVCFGIRELKIINPIAAADEEEETRAALKITLFFVANETQTSGQSQTQELLCSVCLLCGERRNRPVRPGVYCKRSTAPQSHFFPSVNLCCYPFFVFSSPCCTVFRTFPSAGGLRNRPADHMFRGPRRGYSVPNKRFHCSLDAAVSTTGATFIHS